MLKNFFEFLFDITEEVVCHIVIHLKFLFIFKVTFVLLPAKIFPTAITFPHLDNLLHLWLFGNGKTFYTCRVGMGSLMEGGPEALVL
jgi:hypothetical protein